jgi:dihydrodipicolinate synthase/N-acetylneuraminate lyase
MVDSTREPPIHPAGQPSDPPSAEARLPISGVCAQLRPRRRVCGMSAVLLPFEPGGGIDWRGFGAHVARTAEAGLVPAVNMDTGYVQLLDDAQRTRALDVAAVETGGEFVAGAQVNDTPGAPWRADAYRAQMDHIRHRGGTPVVFPSYGLAGLGEEGWAPAHRELAQSCDRFIAFELGPMFTPCGRIYELPAYRALLEIRQCVGAKHSSLSRQLEWQRLAVRDATRPEFQVLTGNDLAIDMVMYGSDYLLGLSTFAPEWFARRDACWEAGDSRFYPLNDLLQYLGQFAFRSPVPAYKHNAAQFLHLRGLIAGDGTHPASPARPDSDREVLAEIAERLEGLARDELAP